MSIYQTAILILALIAILVSWGNWRAIGWLVAGQVSIAVSVAYWKTGWPYGELIAGLCDASVCLMIYALGRYRWEMALWRLFQTMVLVNLIYLSSRLGLIPAIDHDAYSSVLEILNVVIIFLAGGSAALQRINGSGRAFSPWHRVRGAVVALFEKRTSPPFWEVGKA